MSIRSPHRAFDWFAIPVIAVLIVVLTGGLHPRLAADDEKPADPKVVLDKKIMAEIKGRSEIMKNLAHLSDVIGPRLTGSARLERANRWTAEKMKEYGL